MHGSLCEFCIHAGVRLSMCVPVHVYSSLPLGAFCSSGCAIELVLLVHGSLLVSVLYSHRCAIENVRSCPCVYSSVPLERFVQVGVRLSLYYWCMSLCLCEFCIHTGVRSSMYVPVHVYSSLPLERFD